MFMPNRQADSLEDIFCNSGASLWNTGLAPQLFELPGRSKSPPHTFFELTNSGRPDFGTSLL